MSGITVRMAFMGLRGFGYIGTILGLGLASGSVLWWQWLAGGIAATWGIWEHWKKPDDPPSIMSRGIWAETLAVLALSGLWQNSLLLILLLSPAIRACIHMRGLPTLSLLCVHAACIIFWHIRFPAAPSWLWVQVGVLTAVSLYTRVLGRLLQEREQMRRVVALAAFEREQRVQEEERMRLAGQLHDMMGQYWASIIRALDVALAVEGEQRMLFMDKARTTAITGLQDMRTLARGWHDGRQTPKEWMTYLEVSARRLAEITAIEVAVELEEVVWSGIERPNEASEACARIGIEAMTNAVKHADTRLIRLLLAQKRQGIELTVLDQGSGMRTSEFRQREMESVAVGGFEASNEVATGMGLASMSKLAKKAGGRLDWISVPGQGTKVQFTIPYVDGAVFMDLEERKT